ncbi:S26 family signal peptidase [Subtercola sp. Z020]|uniref:S26 family signal peptidase n=1 Tax=Subtercola sp. Z020 TaxID=2080582 RepID=UPI000CE7485F|nr:S26 family signal peptidase [Subtercola sp. Z020]PPF79519.1 S26 family signal peptidase [Subtercola sp. Z020]
MALTSVRSKGAHSGPRRWVGRQTPVSASVRIGLALAVTLLASILIAAFLFFLAGGRWFIVQTPSMGETAPVGTLMLTTPTHHVAVGDIITFHPPTAPNETFTHRVIKVTDQGISTQGDINGAIDPWMLAPTDIVGEAAVILPAAGWFVKALPIVAIGAVLVWFLSSMFHTAARRSAVRIAGFSFVVAAAAYILRPLIGVVVLSTNADETGAHATVVSTGILPIRVQAVGGTSADLVTGQVGDIDIPSLADTSQYHLSSALNMSLVGWIILGAICALPLLWSIVVGLPAENEEAPA